MTTAQEMVNSAALFAGILANNQTLESSVNDDALARLNRLLARLRNNGIDLGLPSLLAADEIIIDDADFESIEFLLALRLMVRYRRPIAPGLAEQAKAELTELRAKYSIIDEMTLDSGLTRKRAFTFQLFN